MTPRRVLSVLSLIVLVILAWRFRPSPGPVAPALTDAPSALESPTPVGSRPSPLAAATEDAYPPPRPPSATEVPTPTLGEDGYYPAPPDRFTRVEALGESPYAAFLEQLQGELDAGDAAALVRRAGEERLLIAAAGSIEGNSGTYNKDELEQLLRALFAEDAEPRIQGYAELDADAYCLDVYVAPWGSVKLPPTATPEPSVEPYGQGEPVLLAGPDFRWRFCRGNSQEKPWEWDEWTFGHLSVMLVGADVGISRPLVLVRPSVEDAADGGPATATLPEMPSDFPASPDGRWTVRRFEGTPAPDADSWPTRLEVLRSDGSAHWVVDAEMSARGICEGARLPLSWSADSRFFFSGLPGCFEGCTQFADSWGILQFDLLTGARRSVPDGSLSPDGRFVAATVHDDRAWWLDLASLEDWVDHRPTRIPGLPVGDDINIGGAVWSPDSRSVALTEVEGFCSEERASAIHVFRLPSPGTDDKPVELTHRGRFASQDGIFNAVGWEADGRVRLRRWNEAGQSAGAWWLDPKTGLFTPDNARP